MLDYANVVYAVTITAVNYVAMYVYKYNYSSINYVYSFELRTNVCT